MAAALVWAAAIVVVLLAAPTESHAGVQTILPVGPDIAYTGTPGGTVTATTAAGCTNPSANLYDRIDDRATPASPLVHTGCDGTILLDPADGVGNTLNQRFHLSDPAQPGIVDELSVAVEGCHVTPSGVPASDLSVTVRIRDASNAVRYTNYGSASNFSACNNYSASRRMTMSSLGLSAADVEDMTIEISLTASNAADQQIRLTAVTLEALTCDPGMATCGRAYQVQTSAAQVWGGCQGPGNDDLHVSLAGQAAVGVPCDPTTGEFQVPLNGTTDPGGLFGSGAIVTVWMTSTKPTRTGDRGSIHLRVRGIGDGLSMWQRVSIIEARGAAITNADIGIRDGDDDPRIPVTVTGTTLTETVPGETVLFNRGTNVLGYRPAGTTIVSKLINQAPLNLTGSPLLELTGSGTSCNAWNLTDASLGETRPFCISNSFAIDVPGTAILRFSGTDTVNIGGGWNAYRLELHPPVGQTQNALMYGSFTVGLGGTAIGAAGSGPVHFSFNGGYPDHVYSAGDLIVADHSSIRSPTGQGRISTESDFTGGGQVELAEPMAVVLRGGGPAVLGPSDPDVAWQLGNVAVSRVGGFPRTLTITSGTAPMSMGSLTIGCNTASAGSGLSIGATTYAGCNAGETVQMDLSGTSRPITAAGDLKLTGQGQVTLSPSAPFELHGNFTRTGASAAAFDASTGEFRWVPGAGSTATLSSSTATTFHDLTLLGPGTLRFENARVTNVTGTLTINSPGCTAANRLTLRSRTPGSAWHLNATGATSTTDVAIEDGHADTPIIGDARVLEIGPNTSGWTFADEPACHDAAPEEFLTDGRVQPQDVASSAPSASFVNQAPDAVTRHRTRIVSTARDGVAGLWQFDGTGAPTLGSGVAVAANGASLSGAGRSGFGQAATLDGIDDTVTIPLQPEHAITGAMTVEAWFRHDPLDPEDPGTAVIVERGEVGAFNYRLHISDGQLAGFVTVTDSEMNTLDSGIYSSQFVSDGEWHHAALVMTTGNVLRLYLDGEDVAGPSVLEGPLLNASTGPITIGHSATQGRRLRGAVDDVRLSNVARSAAEIRGAFRTDLPHYTAVWDSTPADGAMDAADVGQPLSSCDNGVRCANVNVAATPQLLREGARWFVESKVRNTGTWSHVGSDWFEVDAAPSLLISAGNMTFDGVLPGEDVADALQITVSTNHVSGYELSAEYDGAPMTNGTDVLPAFAPSGPGDTDTWAPGDPLGIGVTLLGATGGKDTGRWGTGTLPNHFAASRYAGLAVGTPLMLHSRASATSPTDTINVGVRVNAPYSQPSGEYEAGVLFTVVSNP